MTAAPPSVAARRSPLRRVDWRVLIPGTGLPRDEVLVLGGPPGVAESLVATGWARATTAAERGGPVDGIVVLAEGAGSPWPAADRVRPGGFLYWEVDRRARGGLRRTPERCRRELAARGWTVVAQHWARSGFAPPGSFVPLVAGPLRWCVETQCSARTASRRAALPVLGALARRPRLLGTAVPAHCTVAVRGGGPPVPGWPAPMVETVPPGALAGLDHRAALLTGGEGDWARLVLVAFDPAGTVREVVKIARSGASDASLVAEQRNLTLLRDRMGSRCGPTPLGSGVWSAVGTTRETALAGPSLAVSTGRWPRHWRRAARDLREVARWLTDWHLLERVDETWDAAADRRWWGPVAARYASVFAPTPAERALFGSVSSASRALAGRPFPVVTNHRDLGSWNVVRTAAGVRALDWEVARPGPALADLVYLTLHWEPTARGRRFDDLVAEVAASFAQAGPAARAPARGRVARLRATRDEVWGTYVAALGLDRRFVPLVVARTLAEQALDRCDRLAATGGSGATDRDENHYCVALDAYARARGA